MPTALQQSQLEALWVQAGGNPSAAPMASSIALAESGGNPGARSPSNDWGLWQINGGGPAMLDPLANAQRAVQMSGNGVNWKPWCTAYSDGACGTKGGSFMGAGSPFMRYLTGTPGSTPAMTPVSSTTAAPAVSSDVLFKIPIPIPGIPDFTFTRSNGRAWAGAAALIGGGVVLLLGLTLLATGSIAKATPYLSKFVPQGKPKSSGTQKQEPLTEEEAQMKAEYDDEMAERRRVKVANREGLVREMA